MPQELNRVWGMVCEKDRYYYNEKQVDAVLAENDEKIEELQKATDSAWSKVNAMYDELRHHKYKRCLAKAEWCNEKWADIATLYCKSVWYRKWQLRWLALAEKFKEAK